jgi:CDP-diglyceride synthetase
MMFLIGQCFWLSLPVVIAGILHMVVVKKDWLPALKKPVDFGASIGGERIFGDNKTWRGFVVMIGLSAILGAVQGLVAGPWADQSGVACMSFDVLTFRLGLEHPIFNLEHPDPAWPSELAKTYALVNAVLGLGYALGELPNSFLKRRVKIEPGKTGSGALGALFFVLDQADSVLAALGLGLLAFGYPLAVFLVGSLVLTLVHLALNATLYLLRVRKNL